MPGSCLLPRVAAPGTDIAILQNNCLQPLQRPYLSAPLLRQYVQNHAAKSQTSTFRLASLLLIT